VLRTRPCPARRAALLALAAGSAIAVARAAIPGDPTAYEPVIASGAVTGDHMPAPPVAFPWGVLGLPDLIYRTIAGYRPLTLDLYEPERASSPSPPGRPLVIFIHGGGWSGGHSRQAGAFENWPQVLASIAARGYVVSSVNYRLSGEAAFPGAEQDIKSAIRWLRGHADLYGIDPSRVMLWGASAGGQLAALAATSCGVAELEPPAPSANAAAAALEPPLSDCVQGAVIWYGIFDFAPLLKARAEAGSAGDSLTHLLGCTSAPCAPATVRLASAVSFIGQSTPPMLLVHGIDDHTVPIAQSQEFHDALAAAGRPVQLLALPGIDHSLLGRTPAATRAASLQALAASIAFIDATVGKPR
jgi:acetyl esterase/lipase